MAARLTGAQRRDRIVATSMRLFAERGFAATKTKDLARAAGVSEAMVFKLFPDKKALYRALIRSKIDEAEAALPLERLESSDEAPDRFFGRIAEVIFGRIDADDSFVRLLLFSALEGHPLAAEFDAARVEPVRAVLAAYVARRQDDGELRTCDPEFAARVFMGLVWSFAMNRVVFRDPTIRRVPRDVLSRQIVEVYLEGMRPRGGRRRS